MSEDTKVCKACGEIKGMGSFVRFGEKAGGNGHYYSSDCRTCRATAKRTQYHSDPEARALRLLYSMESGVRKQYPDSWTGSIAREAAKKLLSAVHCAYCQMPNDQTFAFNLDHHVPLALGGAHNLDNLYPCCEPCNRAKHDMPPQAFKAWMDALVLRLG